jgi:hypothetical protein
VLIQLIAAVPTVYCFVKDASANLREKDDTLNTTIGAFFGGAMLGLRCEETYNHKLWLHGNANCYGTALRMPQILGQGALVSVVLTAFDYTGGLVGKKTESEFADEYERKEYLRKNRRRPLMETVADLGEGRGTLSPRPGSSL